LGVCLVLTPLAVGLAFAAAPAGAPKTHVLFMGANIALERGKEVHPVADVTATAVVIKPGGQRVELPIARGQNYLISESLKVAEGSVGIDHLESERAYTPGADPFEQLAKAQAFAAGQAMVTELADAAETRAMQGVVTETNAMRDAAGTPAEGSASEALRQAELTLSKAQTKSFQVASTPDSVIYDGVKMGGESMFDAIRVTFEVTPKNDLAQPYYAIIAQIREHDSKPGQVRKWAYVRSLGPISAGEVRNVSVYRGGLPPGYILESCEVHVYNQGEELSTNLSRKSVPLTEEEAQEYRIFEYISANKGRTLSAVLTTTTLSGEARFSLTKAQLDETHYVRVAKTGQVVAAFRDAAGQQTLRDPPLEAVLKTLRFKPALAAGKPVESIAPIHLGQIGTL